MIYGQDGNLLIDIKGRRVAPRGRMDEAGVGGARVTTAARSRLECWVTEEDIHSLIRWQGLFGEGFTAAFVFVYWCVQQPPDAMFQEIFEYRGRWYALRTVTLDTYRQVMKPRSLRWRTVDIPSAVFERVSQPFAPPPPPPSTPPPTPTSIFLDPKMPRSSGHTVGTGPRQPKGWQHGSQPSDMAEHTDTISTLDDPGFDTDLGPQLPALHPYTSSPRSV